MGHCCLPRRTINRWRQFHCKRRYYPRKHEDCSPPASGLHIPWARWTVRRFLWGFCVFFMSVPFLVFHYCLHVNSVTPSLANCETLIIAKRKDREKLRFYIDTDRSPWQMLTTKYSRKHCLIVCVLPRGDWAPYQYRQIYALPQKPFSSVKIPMSNSRFCRQTFQKRLTVFRAFFYSLLKQANIGSVIFKGIRLCYSNYSTRQLSKPVPIHSSVQQGYPL